MVGGKGPNSVKIWMNDDQIAHVIRPPHKKNGCVQANASPAPQHSKRTYPARAGTSTSISRPSATAIRFAPARKATIRAAFSVSIQILFPSTWIWLISTPVDA